MPPVIPSSGSRNANSATLKDYGAVFHEWTRVAVELVARWRSAASSCNMPRDGV